MAQVNRDEKPAASRLRTRHLLSVSLLCFLASGLLWFFDPPVVEVPAEIDALETPELEIELSFPGADDPAVTEVAATLPEGADEEVRVAGLISAPQDDSSDSENAAQSEQSAGTIYWAFPDEGSQGTVLHMPSLVKLPSIENQLSSIENELPSVENELPTIDDELPTIEYELPSVENELPTIDDELPTIEYELPSVENELPTIEGELPTIEYELPSDEDELPTAQNELPSVEYELPSVENERPTLENEPPAAENEPQSVEIELPSVENKPAPPEEASEVVEQEIHLELPEVGEEPVAAPDAAENELTQDESTDDESQVDESPEEELTEEELTEDEAEVDEPIAILMPPMEVPPAENSLVAQVAAAESPSIQVNTPERRDPGIVVPMTPTPSDFADLERQLVEQIIREANLGATGELTDSRINEVATDKIHQANALARRGAPYAARQKLIQVLRMVSQAKDARSRKPQYSAALAAGLRALSEAEDFLPRGAQLEAELDVDLVVGAHRTPLAEQLDLSTVMPQQMLDRYLRYAQLKMAMSVAGDPAGSMALYALGKVTSQMGQIDLPADRLTHRQAVAFQQASLLAHNQNHYAAHELAVLLAESGHYRPSHQLLVQVAARQPKPMVYRNLARVERRLGLIDQARASQDRARQLSASAGSQLINWVPPQQFAKGSEPVRRSTNHNLARQPSTARRR